MLIHIAAGIIVGAFMPAVGRKIKALFVKESAVVKPVLVGTVKKIL